MSTTEGKVSIEVVTEQVTFTFSPREFSRIQGMTLLCSPPKEMRPLLAGVHFNRVDGSLRLEATNSYVLGTIEMPEVTGEFDPFVVSASLINKVKLTARQKLDVSYGSRAIALVFDQQLKIVQISYEGNSFSEKALEGTYPSLQNVLDGAQTRDNLGVVGIASDFIARIGKWFEGAHLALTFTGENKLMIVSTMNPAFNSTDFKATAYLMPVRVS